MKFVSESEKAREVKTRLFDNAPTIPVSNSETLCQAKA